MTTTTAAYDWATHCARMRATGLWLDLTVDDLLSRAIAQAPDKLALVAYRADTGWDAPVRRISYAELGALVDKAAGSLRARGIGPGDVVAIMLPNWWEFVVAAYACNRLGAIPNPLMHIFRERELRFMLKFADTKAIFVPQHFRGFDFPAMLAGLRAELPALQHVIAAGGKGPDSFDALLTGDAAPVTVSQGHRIDPTEPCVLMYTSGTTGEPKGVMHCFNTLVACTNALAGRFGHTTDDVHIGAAPFGHMTGYAAIMLQGLSRASTVVLQDVWDGTAATGIMVREGVTHMAGATPFLADICRVVGEGAPAPALRTFLCGGAQIPPVVIENARKLLGLNVSSLWGMTEGLSGSLTEPGRAAEKSASTDGRAVEGVELLIADENLKPMPTGKTGRLYFRGTQQFIGYYKRPGLCGRGPEGWFDTGDLAYMDAEGYIRIDGRSKD
ncbi:MAG: AMP-binding protein, partial [Gemmobacter sp.]|nr:AMP-binding protein [Gemmobacter sp.]